MSKLENPLSFLSGDTPYSYYGGDTDQISQMLRDADLRPTRQRLALAALIYSKGVRHVSAEQLHEEALAANVPVSLATVYNTLHQFRDAGLLRAVIIDTTKTYFDTDVGHHHHFFDEDENSVKDIPAEQIEFGQLPEPPEGMEIAKIDVIIRLRPKGR